MPRVQVLQFRLQPFALAHEQKCISRELAPGVEADYVSVFDTNLTLHNPEALTHNYAGVVFGGSGDFDFDGNRPLTDPVRQTSLDFVERLRPLLDYIFMADIPTLGICYGHQLLGAYAGAVVYHDPAQSKTRSHALTLLVDKNSRPILQDMPETFYAQYGHKDVLDRVPEGAQLLICGGEACQVSALQYRNNIYTVQFHPELTAADIAERIKQRGEYLPDGATVETVFTEDPHAALILRNFAALVAAAEAKK